MYTLTSDLLVYCTYALVKLLPVTCWLIVRCSVCRVGILLGSCTLLCSNSAGSTDILIVRRYCSIGIILIALIVVFVVVLVDFTDEEGYGRYLDLHESYERYINLKGVQRMDYVTYLSNFDKMFELPKEKKNAVYRDYLSNLIEYMEGYMSRIKPLLDMQDELNKVVHCLHPYQRSLSIPYS